MGVEENKAALKAAIDDFNDPDNRRAYLEVHDRSVTAHGLGSEEPVDFEGVTQFYETLWAAFPDVVATVEDVFGEGEKLCFRVTVTATHKGDFMGTPATGNPVRFGVQNLYYFRDGKVVERWSNADLLGLMVQLGAIPAPA
jgi:predicted ester cyclase